MVTPPSLVQRKARSERKLSLPIGESRWVARQSLPGCPGPRIKNDGLPAVVCHICFREVTSLPLNHQQVAQTRVVKGIGCDQHGALPSLLPSRANTLCWRGRWTDLRESDVFDTMINQLSGYRTNPQPSATANASEFHPIADTCRGSSRDAHLIAQRPKNAASLQRLFAQRPAFVSKCEARVLAGSLTTTVQRHVEQPAKPAAKAATADPSGRRAVSQVMTLCVAPDA